MLVRLYAPQEFLNWLNGQPKGSPSRRYGDAALRFVPYPPSRPTIFRPP